MSFKFAKVDKEILNNFWHFRITKDAINKAISRAKQLGLSNADIQPLIILKLQNNQLFAQAEKDVIHQVWGSNLVNFGNNWYGLLCEGATKKNKYDFIVAPFKNLDFEKVYLELGIEKNKPRTAWTQFLDNNVNYDVLDIYQIQSTKKADELLSNCFQYTVSVVKNKEVYRLSVHCIDRWVERIDNYVGKIDLSKREEIVKKLTSTFLHSDCVYCCNSNQTRFFLNLKKMVFFAVTNDNTIVTVWKNVYGFSDLGIDKDITLLQLDYLSKLKKNIPNVVKNLNHQLDVQMKEKNIYIDNLNNVSRIREEYEAQILDIQQKCSALKQQEEKISEIITNIDIQMQAITKQKSDCVKNLQNEEAKIFKAHKMIDVGDNDE